MNSEDITSIKDQWKNYFEGCYPDGASLTQSEQLEQAFFAGALYSLALAGVDGKECLLPRYITLFDEACEWANHKPRKSFGPSVTD